MADDLDQQAARLLRAYQDAADAESRLDQARGDFYRELVAAKQAGMTTAAIGRLLGITRQRVKQLLDRER